MPTNSNRRRFLQIAGSAGVAGIAGLAGCSGGGGGDGGGDGGGSTTTAGGGGGGGATTTSGGGGEGGGDTITLGGSMSLSGDNADLGQLYKDAYELTIKRINDGGGVKAGDGKTYQLKMDLRDDETDASKSQSIYQELVDRQGVDFLLGPYSSTVTLPASAVASNKQRPMVEGGGSSPEIFSQGNKWIFGLLPTANKYANSGIDMAMAQSPKPSSIAILAEDDTFSQSTAEGARKKAQDAGLDVAVDQTFPSDTTDLSTNLSKVKDAGASILLLCAHQQHNIILAKQMQEQDVNPDMAMGTVGSLNDSFKQEVGANADYIYGPSSWAVNAKFKDPVYGSTGDFVSAIKSTYDYNPDYHSAAGASVILTFMAAFQQVSDVSPTPVRDAIRNIDLQTLYGTIAFDDSGIIDLSMLVYQWQPDKDLQIVWPSDVAQSEPIYPTPHWSDR